MPCMPRRLQNQWMLLLLTLAMPLSSIAASSAPGTWHALEESARLDGCRDDLEPDAVPAMMAALDPVLAMLRRTPGLSEPQAVDIQPRRMVQAWPRVDPARNCLGAELVLQLHRLLPDPGCATCAPMPSPRQGAAIWVYANNPFVPLLEELLARRGTDEVGSGMFLAPREVTQVAGLPVYESRDGWWVVVAPHHVRYWEPVTRERYLSMRRDEATAQIALHDTGATSAADLPEALRATAAEMDGARAAALAQARDRLTRIEQAFAASSAGELRQPAWCCDPHDALGSQLLPPDSDGYPVVTIAPLPAHEPGDIGMLAIRFRLSSQEARDPDALIRDLIGTVRDQIDWQGLTALLTTNDH
jgi:hypothetical protein